MSDFRRVYSVVDELVWLSIDSSSEVMDIRRSRLTGAPGRIFFSLDVVLLLTEDVEVLRLCGVRWELFLSTERGFRCGLNVELTAG